MLVLIILVGILWLGSWVILLKPFVRHQTGLETLDALDAFMIRQGLLLCLFIFALFPSVPTGFVGLLALLPKATLKRSLILICFSILALAISPYCETLNAWFTF